VKETVPNGKEAVYTGWKLIGYRVKVGKRDAYSCLIAPFDQRVVPGFEDGVWRFDRQIHCPARFIRLQPVSAMRHPNDLLCKIDQVLAGETRHEKGTRFTMKTCKCRKFRREFRPYWMKNR
jgi:hypothetical protein